MENEKLTKSEPKSLRIVNVSKIFKDYKTGKDFAAVDNVSLEIKAGSFVTLLGPSGCGKTTTLRMIAGFESPSMGEIYLGDEAINTLPPNKRDTAMVFQSYALLPHYNVFENVAYGLKIRKVPKPEIQRRVKEILKLVELEGFEERMTNQLSGGQQQRVALARALVVEPGVLLFDEPLSNLDAKLRVAMRTEIRKIQQKIGITAVYVTHDQSEAMAISDQIIIMKNGKIAQMGTPEEIYYKPNSEFVADFIGEVNFIEGTVESKSESNISVKIGDKVVAMKNSENAKVGDKCKIVLRPEAASISESGILPCEVVFSSFMGSYQYYQADVGGKIVKICDYNPRGRKIYSAGEKAFLDFNAEELHLL